MPELSICSICKKAGSSTVGKYLLFFGMYLEFFHMDLPIYSLTDDAPYDVLDDLIH
jgi:hypothetical protein